MILRFLARQRAAFARDTSDSPRRWRLSPATYLELLEIVPTLRRHARGAVLDVGCGTLPFVTYCEDLVERWDGLDREARSPRTRYLCDAEAMTPVADASYDTVVCLSALEHMPRPWRALAEMARVARPGAALIIVVPHLSRLHEEPHDYLRFTPYGVRALLEGAGFEPLEVRGVGGPLSFFGHQLSTLLVTATWSVPLLKWVVYWLNYVAIVRPAIFLDRLLRLERRSPLDVLVVARRAESGATDG